MGHAIHEGGTRMIRFTALLAVIGAALVGVASIGAAPAAPKKLTGAVGPSETI